MRIFCVVLNTIGKSLCVVEQTENYRFYRIFSVILLGSNATDVENMAIFVISDSKLTRNDVLFYAHFDFNGHFRHFGRSYLIEEINGKRLFAIPNNVMG